MTTVFEKKYLNAQVHVDVKDRKVRFQYPDLDFGSEWKTELGNIWRMVLAVWFLLMFIFVVLYVIIGSINTVMTRTIAINIPSDSELLGYGLLLGIIFGVPAVVTLVIFLGRDHFAEHYPKIQERVYSMEEYIKRVSKIDGKEFKIPLFQNVKLEYEAHGDFKQKLLTVDINPVYYLISRKGKEENEILHWEAVFTFENTPKDGFIEVRFK